MWRQDLQLRWKVLAFAAQKWQLFVQRLEAALGETARLDQTGLHRVIQGERAAAFEVARMFEGVMAATWEVVEDADAHSAALRAALTELVAKLECRLQVMEGAFGPLGADRRCALDDYCYEAQQGRRRIYALAINAARDLECHAHGLAPSPSQPADEEAGV